MSVSIPLRQPIKAHGGDLHALVLRRPTGRDIRTCGAPYKITQDSEIAVEAAAMHRMIAQLAGVPPSSIDQLDAADWDRASQAVLGFITGTTPETAPAPAPTTEA